MTKDSKKRTEDPVVKELKGVFGEFLLSVCKVEFTEESPELEIPKTEEMVVAIVNDLRDKKAEKLIANYKNNKIKLLPLSGLWQSCYDKKYELLEALTNPKSTQIMYDKGLIRGLTAAQQLKRMAISKLKRYIMTLILFGSVSRGTMTETSDVDLAFVIDDTDVKRMSRHEVLARLRKMIYRMAAETGFEFNIQVYLLTDFWQSLRDTHPVIFSMVRDGVPLYDTGLFIPWKTLLKMGKLKPSPEAVEQFYKTGRLLIQDIKNSLKEIVVERVFLSMFNPAQAAIMLIGIPPTDAVSTPKQFKKHFVDDLKLVDKKYYEYLQKIVDVRKDVEHGKIKEIEPKEFVNYMKMASEFQDMIDKLFTDIRNNLIKKSLENAKEQSINAVIESLKQMGIDANKKNALELLKTKLLDNGLITGSDYFFIAKELPNAEVHFNNNLLTTEEASIIERKAKDFVKNMERVAQLYALKSTDKNRIHFRYGEKNGELWIIGDEVFIIKDLKYPEKDISRAKLNKDGTFTKVEISNLKELNDARKKAKADNIVTTIKAGTLESVNKLFKEELEFVFV